MKVSAQVFQQAVRAHFAEEVIPNVANPVAQWVLAGASAVDAFSGQKVLTSMRMVGVADEGGNVDVDKLEAFFKGAFGKQPHVELPLVGVVFEASDAEAFVKRLRGA